MSNPNKQWQFKIEIERPINQVWEAIEDLSLIPKYHPKVRDVKFVTGQSRRAPGVEYKCVIPDGRQKGWCTEKVLENIQNKKMTITFVEDSWGLAKMFKEVTISLLTEPIGPNRTKLVMEAYYQPNSLKFAVLNTLFMKVVMKMRAKKTMLSLKALLEGIEGTR